MRGVTDLLRRSPLVIFEREVTDDVLDHDHGAVNNHTEIQRAERKQVRGNMNEIQANSRK